MDYLERAAMRATSTGVSVAADAYGYGREVYGDARDVANIAESTVNAGVDVATNAAQGGYDTVERGVAGAIPGVIGAAADAWSWMTD